MVDDLISFSETPMDPVHIKSPFIVVLQSPGPLGSLFVPLTTGRVISIGSGTSSDLRLPGTALNHVTINGVDKLLSDGSTEISLNGIEVTEDMGLLHGDILTLPNYKLIYLDPSVDVMKIKQQNEAKFKVLQTVTPTPENSNTESAEETRDDKTSKPTQKPSPRANYDAAWRKRLAEAAFDIEEENKDQG